MMTAVSLINIAVTDICSLLGVVILEENGDLLKEKKGKSFEEAVRDGDDENW